MATWIISRPIAGFGNPTKVEADDIAYNELTITLYKDKQVVCVITQTPGLLVKQKDSSGE